MKSIPIRHIRAGQNEPVSSGRFNIRDVSDLLGGKGLVHELHKHDFFFVLALQKGSGTHEIDFTNYNVIDNSIFILRPGQVHQLELKANCTGFLMEFDSTFYHTNNNVSNLRLRKANSKAFCELDIHRFKKVIGILANIFDEYTSKQEGYVEVVKANLDIFFVEFIRQSQNPQSISNDSSSYTQGRYDDFLEVLGDRITNLKQVSQYADLMNLSTYQLNAITKATIGKSASEMINEQIILEAKRYLLATPNQVKDIADHLGYEDSSYFIRFFKKHTGFSPEAFRKNFL